MLGLRRLISFRRRNDVNSPSSSERTPSPDAEESTYQACQDRSTFDPFVIPQRTRYPSTKASAPDLLDTSVARALLEHQPQRLPDTDLAINQTPRQLNLSTARERDERNDTSGGGFGILNDHKSTSRSTSGHSVSRFKSIAVSMPNPGSPRSGYRDTTHYVEMYNSLARYHGLKELGAVYESITECSQSPLPQLDGPATPTPSRHSSKNWLMNKLVRTPSLANLKTMEPRLSKKGSIGNLLLHRGKPSNQCQTLDDICRLGGISLLHLPRNYAAVDLTIPTCLAATANFLVLYGREVPGIFRIPGQNTSVNALYQYYMIRIRDSQEMGEVETTIGSLTLPSNISFNAHDIASAFKKFLRDIPGGILGSLKLFSALKDICTVRTDRPSRNLFPEKARIVALALFSVQSKPRVALISAVFGLLAFLKQDPGDEADLNRSGQLGHECMTSNALGVVFAPILLGDLTEQVEIDTSAEEEGLRQDQQATKRNLFGRSKTPKHVRSKFRNKDMAASVEKTKACATLMEHLILSWEDIVKQCSTLEASSASQNLASYRALRGDGAHFSTSRKNTGRDMPRMVSDDSCEYNLPKAASNPMLVGSRQSTKVPTHRPATELEADSGMYRSTSMSVIPRGRGEPLRVQIETPSGGKHFSRSTTVLHSTETTAWQSSPSFREDRTVLTYSQNHLGWWERPFVPISDCNAGSVFHCAEPAQDEENVNENGDIELIGDSKDEALMCSSSEVRLDSSTNSDKIGDNRLAPDLGSNNLDSCTSDAVDENNSSPTGASAAEGYHQDADNAITGEFVSEEPERSTPERSPIAGQIATPATRHVTEHNNDLKAQSNEPQSPLTTPKEDPKTARRSPSMIPRPASEFAKGRRGPRSPAMKLRGQSAPAGSPCPPYRGKG